MILLVFLALTIPFAAGSNCYNRPFGYKVQHPEQSHAYLTCLGQLGQFVQNCAEHFYFNETQQRCLSAKDDSTMDNGACSCGAVYLPLAIPLFPARPWHCHHSASKATTTGCTTPCTTISSTCTTTLPITTSTTTIISTTTPTTTSTITTSSSTTSTTTSTTTISTTTTATTSTVSTTSTPPITNPTTKTGTIPTTTISSASTTTISTTTISTTTATTSSVSTTSTPPITNPTTLPTTTTTIVTIPTTTISSASTTTICTSVSTTPKKTCSTTTDTTTTCSTVSTTSCNNSFDLKPKDNPKTMSNNCLSIPPDCNRLRSGTYVRDMVQCNKYYVCLNGRAIAQYCAPGFFFDEQKRLCNFPQLVECNSCQPVAITKQL